MKYQLFPDDDRHAFCGTRARGIGSDGGVYGSRRGERAARRTQHQATRAGETGSDDVFFIVKL